MLNQLSQPGCAVSCGNPGVPTNGEVFGTLYSYSQKLRFDCLPGYRLVGSIDRTCGADGRWSGSQPRCDRANCGANLVGPSGTFSSTNFPNGYGNNEYCRWKITVRSDRQVMLTFKTLKTQADKDFVEVYDGKSGKLISKLSGIHGKPFSLTSNSNVMDVKFYSDAKDVTVGFEAAYEPVTCGGLVTQLDTPIRSPNYPNNYPGGATCVWAINLGRAFQLEFDSFNTEPGYDYLAGYDSLSSFTGANCGANLVGPTGTFSSTNFPNGYGNNEYCRWKITVRSDRQVMLTFKTLKTQADKDFVEVYDGKSGKLISKLSGIHGKPFSLTSNSNVMDVKFYSDAKDVTVGFEAAYEPV
ncbi:hypothetical protein QZH41_008635, partial [Actinostola sp. cb2023]